MKLAKSVRSLAVAITACAVSLGGVCSPGHAQAAHPGTKLKEDPVSTAATTERSKATISGKEAIRPFRVNVPEEALADLRRRIEATRWPEKETVMDQSQGVPLATIQRLAAHWAEQYDWRKCEARLNACAQFITEIDGLDIHFIHVRSKHADALPLIITHGWPGSMVEQLKLVGPLTDPTAHGGRAEDAFDVVIPNMPGYGYSGKPTATGWGPERIARAWSVLMKRLGYTRYAAQGGDWGSVVVDFMAKLGDPALVGIHTNMPGVVPPEVDAAAFAGKPAPAGLSAEEKQAYERLAFTYRNVAYAFYMGWHPQSLCAIADSPVGLATFLLDHDPSSLELFVRSIDGAREGITPDDLLDNITLFWLTNTGVSAARLYAEYKQSYFGTKGVTIPVAVSVFPDEIEMCPRSWTERAYPNLIHYNKVAKGGHFAAWEQPELFTAELRTGLRSLRSAASATKQ